LSRYLDILNDKSARLESIPDALLSASERFQREVFRIVESLTRSLTTKNGNIEMTVANLEKVERIDGLIRKAMGDSDYFKAAVAFKNEMSAQSALTIDYFAALTGAEVATAFGDALVRTRQAEALNLILGSSMEAGFVQPLKDQLIAAVANNAGISTTFESLQTFVLGNDQVDGRLLRYTRTYASDIFATTDRAYTSVVADDLGLEWYLYTGGRMDTTRCFCKSRNAKFWHRKEIEAWGRGEGVGECGFPWAGMARGTNEATIFTYVGGYNCQHSLGPVSEAVVPPEDIARARAKGYVE
jgi:hypothetical protein